MDVLAWGRICPELCLCDYGISRVRVGVAHSFSLLDKFWCIEPLWCFGGAQGFYVGQLYLVQVFKVGVVKHTYIGTNQ